MDHYNKHNNNEKVLNIARVTKISHYYIWNGNQRGPTIYIAHGTLLNVMWQPGWEGSLGKNRYMYVYDWVPLLFIWNYHSIVNWLYPITK